MGVGNDWENGAIKKNFYYLHLLSDVISP